MTSLTLESMRQYKELGVFIESGGIEIARTEERMQELDPADGLGEVVGDRAGRRCSPRQQVKELVPFIDESLILGGFYTPGAGVVDSLQAGTIMRERAIEAGLTVRANTEVLGIDVAGGRVRRVQHHARRHRRGARRDRLRRVEPAAGEDGRRRRSR